MAMAMAMVATATPRAVAVAVAGTLSSFQEWRIREQVRGLVVGTGTGGNLEHVLLSSLGGPGAREAGQEGLKNPPVGICICLFNEQKPGWRQKPSGHRGYATTLKLDLKIGVGARERTPKRGHKWTVAAKTPSRFPLGLLEPFWASLPPKPGSLELRLIRLAAKSEGLWALKKKYTEGEC